MKLEEKLTTMLEKISSLSIRPQTKLNILSRYIPSQVAFELKIYNFPATFLTGVVDRLCTLHIRRWLEFPLSSCVTEWASSPVKFCGLGIPTFSQRSERLQLTKRNALMSSKNPTIRIFWSATRHPNILTDSRLEDLGSLKAASSSLKASQNDDSVSHFLGLKSQGVISKTVNEVVLPSHVTNWKSTLDKLPDFIHNFVRKAMMNQLPTLKNLKMWGCSTTDLCPRCGACQSNKHVLSNCGSPEALSMYLDRHNKILRLIANWILSRISAPTVVYSDLTIPGIRHVSDLFIGHRPDIAIVLPSKIIVGELTVCHETNLVSSRDYKLNKYANLSLSKSCAVKQLPVSVHTIEVSALGFVVVEPNFLKEGGLPKFSPAFLSELSSAAILSSHHIYCHRQ
jgi:hypothetical protein